MKKRVLIMAALSITLLFGGCGRHSSRSTAPDSSDYGEHEEINTDEDISTDDDDNADSATSVDTESKNSSIEDKVSETDTEQDTGKTLNQNPDQISFTTEEVQDTLGYMNNAMSGYISAIMWNQDYEYLNSPDFNIDVRINDAEAIRAAAMAVMPDGRINDCFVIVGDHVEISDTEDYGPYGDGLHGESLDMIDVNRKCLDLFGMEADLNKLQTDVKCWDLDAVRYNDAGENLALLIYSGVENETAQEFHDFRVKKDADGYIGEVDMFFGYWGIIENNPGLSNYTVTYKIALDEDSRYGLAITDINIKAIDSYTESEYSEQPDSSTVTDNTPFYGIWCSAAKDEADAQKSANTLTEKGLDGRVYVTTDWSNLNKEKWYVVSAGAYATEADANAMLDTVKAAGYGSAYVKYSGDYIGE